MAAPRHMQVDEEPRGVLGVFDVEESVYLKYSE